MSVTVFWCEWEERKKDSHELLRMALERYLEQEPAAPVEGHHPQEDEPEAGGTACFRREDMLRLCLTKTEKGKPYFENFPQVKFSISHSGNFWACAFGDAEVGLDLQGAYKKDGEKLARRFFHPEEIAWLERNGFAQFSRVWTHKESYVKFTGLGLTQGLDYFSVVPWLEGNDGGICQQEIPFREGFWMVLTSDEPQEIEVRQFFLSYRKLRFPIR